MNDTIDGASGSTVVGALYLPSTSLNHEGNSTSTGYTIIVAGQLAFTGSSQLNDNYSSLDGGGSPIHSAVVVE